MKSNSKKLRKKKFFEPLLLYIAHWCDTFPRSLWHVEELLTVLVEWTMLEVQAPPPLPGLRWSTHNMGRVGGIFCNFLNMWVHMGPTYYEDW